MSSCWCLGCCRERGPRRKEGAERGLLGLPSPSGPPNVPGRGAFCTTTISEDGVCRQPRLRELSSASLKRPAPGPTGLAILGSSGAPCVRVRGDRLWASGLTVGGVPSRASGIADIGGTAGDPPNPGEDRHGERAHRNHSCGAATKSLGGISGQGRLLQPREGPTLPWAPNEGGWPGSLGLPGHPTFTALPSLP